MVTTWIRYDVESYIIVNYSLQSLGTIDNERREEKERKECQTLLSMSLTSRIHHGIIGMECVGVVFVRMTSHIQNQAPDMKEKEMNTAVKKWNLEGNEERKKVNWIHERWGYRTRFSLAADNKWGKANKKTNWQERGRDRTSLTNSVIRYPFKSSTLISFLFS